MGLDIIIRDKENRILFNFRKGYRILHLLENEYNMYELEDYDFTDKVLTSIRLMLSSHVSNGEWDYELAYIYSLDLLNRVMEIENLYISIVN